MPWQLGIGGWELTIYRVPGAALGISTSATRLTPLSAIAMCRRGSASCCALRRARDDPALELLGLRVETDEDRSQRRCVGGGRARYERPSGEVGAVGRPRVASATCLNPSRDRSRCRGDTGCRSSNLSAPCHAAYALVLAGRTVRSYVRLPGKARDRAPPGRVRRLAWPRRTAPRPRTGAQWPCAVARCPRTRYRCPPT